MCQFLGFRLELFLEISLIMEKKKKRIHWEVDQSRNQENSTLSDAPPRAGALGKCAGICPSVS